MGVCQIVKIFAKFLGVRMVIKNATQESDIEMSQCDNHWYNEYRYIIHKFGAQLIKRFVIGFICLTLFSCTSQNNQRPVELRIEAVDSLYSVLYGTTKWAKVHAGEYLIQLDYRKAIDSVFKAENEEFGQEEGYRIGIWRVLALASRTDEQRDFWISKIKEVYENDRASDKIHALESLAKLGISVETDPGEIVSADAVFKSWAYALSSPDAKTSVISRLIKNIESEEVDLKVKKRSVYVLRQLGSLDTREWNELFRLAINLENYSDLKFYLNSLLYVTAPTDTLHNNHLDIIENALYDYTTSDNLTLKREIALALSERGDTSHIDLLQKYLRQKEDGNFEEISDLRTAAALAILRIDRRQVTRLAGLDWFVIVLYGASMLGIGFFYSRKNKTKEDYLLGGRQMNSVLVGISLFATLLSTVSYVSYPGEMIKYGPVIFAGMLGFPLVYFVAGWWLIPRIMEMKVTSAYEILELKLGLSIRVLATFMFLSLRFLWMATIMYATVDVALLSVVPIDNFYVPYISTLLLLITIVYTSMGGLRAVVVTDVIQTVIFLGGALISILMVCYHFGSFTS